MKWKNDSLHTIKEYDTRTRHRISLCILFGICFLALTLWGCENTAGRPDEVQIAASAADEADLETAADLKSSSGERGRRKKEVFLSSFTEENFRGMNRDIAILIAAMYYGNEYTDTRKLLPEIQGKIISDYVDYRLKRNDADLGKRSLFLDKYARIRLSGDDVRQILYSYTGQKYHDDLRGFILASGGYYCFDIRNATCGSFYSLEKPVIHKCEDCISVTAELWKVTMTETVIECETVFSLVPDADSEFGAYVDDVSFDSSCHTVKDSFE